MPDIKHSISIEAMPNDVHPLIASGRGFSQWWAADITEDNSSGIVELGFFNRATIYRLQPAGIVAPKKAEWLCETGKEWQGTKILFELTQNKNGSLLRFTHADWQAETDYFVSCNTQRNAITNPTTAGGKISCHLNPLVAIARPVALPD
jgi:hypothetical protein